MAWYWRDFDAPPNPHPGGRTLLRFGAVDYLADVWLNGEHVGGHEGGETPFEIDVTGALRSGEGQHNRLAVRVLNPTNERIDGVVLAETARRCKVIPYSAGAAFDHGGVVGPVELIHCPEVRIEDIAVVATALPARPGRVSVEVTVINAGRGAAQGFARSRARPGGRRRNAGRDATQADVPARHVARPVRPDARAAETVGVERPVPLPGERARSGRGVDRRSTRARRGSGSATSASPTATSGSTAAGSTSVRHTPAITSPSGSSSRTIPTCSGATC